jgi:hypothetical protein
MQADLALSSDRRELLNVCFPPKLAATAFDPKQTLTVPSKSRTFDNGDSAQPPRFYAESMVYPYSLVKN